MTDLISKATAYLGTSEDNLEAETVHIEIKDGDAFEENDLLLIIQSYGSQDTKITALDMEDLFSYLTAIKYVPPVEYLRMCDHEGFLSDFQEDEQE